MAYSQVYSAYRDTNVKTASQGKLIVLLYEETIRQLTAASSYFTPDGKIGASHIEKFNANILKVQEIITELQVSLDMERGGEIAKSLMALYVYFKNELLDANIKRDRKKIDFVRNMMTQLCDAWRTTANSTANAPAAIIPAALNIEG